MRINNNYYDEVIYRYSRTAEALSNEAPGKFDALLAGIGVRGQGVGVRDNLLANSAEMYSRTNSGRDTLLANAADRYSHRTETSGYDALLYDAAKKYGAVTCV
ncbi:MAG: hypothetical protein IJR85_07350 [Synergistaceae bacterium]|nr:hypothetical protein [Synergistaceae bacterium]